MRFALLALVFSATVIAPVVLTAEPVEACQPLSWVCPLNGQWYYICGTHIPPPIVQCARDTIEDASLP